MNRRRTDRRMGRGAMVVIIIAAGIVAAAGIFHVYIKNKQLQLSREIQKIEDTISEDTRDIRNYQIRIDERLNRHLIRDALRERKSELIPIPSNAVEVVDSLVPRSSLQKRREK